MGELEDVDIFTSFIYLFFSGRGGWGEGIMTSIKAMAEHNLEQNSPFLLVTPKSIILDFYT